MSRCLLILVILHAALPSVGRGAAGDVSFRIPDRAWHADVGGLSLVLDVFTDVDSQASVPAIGWGMVINITPQPGATGTVSFAPPAIVGNLPNLSPASTNAYLDFDLDQNGKSYGESGASISELNAFAAYVEPTVASPPMVDGNGNLTLPTDSGLAALPIALSPDASGSFLISFEPDPRVTGVVYATGLAEPNDIALHPVAQHTTGLLSIIATAGDYNTDGVVNAADYTVWRDTLGDAGTALLADGSGNGLVDAADYQIWKNNFGAISGTASAIFTSVPEPTSLVVFATILWSAFCTRLAKTREIARSLNCSNCK